MQKGKQKDEWPNEVQKNIYRYNKFIFKSISKTNCQLDKAIIIDI
jgi:hypothetical protein